MDKLILDNSELLAKWNSILSDSNGHKLESEEIKSLIENLRWAANDVMNSSGECSWEVMEMFSTARELEKKLNLSDKKISRITDYTITEVNTELTWVYKIEQCMMSTSMVMVGDLEIEVDTFTESIDRPIQWYTFIIKLIKDDDLIDSVWWKSLSTQFWISQEWLWTKLGKERIWELKKHINKRIKDNSLLTWNKVAITFFQLDWMDLIKKPYNGLILGNNEYSEFDLEPYIDKVLRWNWKKIASVYNWSKRYKR